MRRILFRGKRLDNGEWVYGDFFHRIVHNDTFHQNTVVTAIEVFDGKNPLSIAYYTVDPETVGQFTGKTDKIGKKVFEHDILQTFTVWADGTVEKGGIGIVQWRENDQCYVLTTKEGYHIDDFGNLGRPEYYEVIGNIHDNPELLEVGA